MSLNIPPAPRIPSDLEGLDGGVMTNLVDEILAWLANMIAAIITALYEGIQAIIEWLVAMLDGILSVIWQVIQDIFAAVTTWLESLFTALEEVLTGIVDAVWAFLSEAWDTIYEATVGVLDAISSYISDIAADVAAFVADLIDTVNGWIEAAVDWISNVVEQGIAGIQSVVQAAIDTIAGFVYPIVETVQSILAATIALINQAWETLVTGVGSIIETVAAKIGDLSAAFGEAAEQLVSTLTEVSEDMLGPLRDAVRDFTEAYLPKDDPVTAQRAIKALQGIHTDPAAMSAFRAWWDSEWQELAKAGPLRKGIFFFAFFLMALAPTVMGISQTLSVPAIQEYSKLWPYQVLNPADATNAWRRGLLSEGSAIDDIRRQGYTQTQAEQILKLTSIVPGASDMVQMWWRGIIDDKGLDEGLKHQGVDEPWRSRIRQAAEIIPPVQDLIHMAVRDVWNPQAVELGKLHEAFPSEVQDWTEKMGLSSEWARLYWAAHWSLPSPLQGFEMLHRQVINEPQLDTLLQALDVAPGWRDPLKAIAYHPFTRVDVRRMHALGILSESEVTRAYEDLGYDHDKALALTEFTVKLNAPKAAEDDAELGTLSRTSVLNFYGDGILTRERAHQLLVDMGHTPEAASLYLEQVDLEEQRKERKSEADLIIERAESGQITFDEAADKLRGLGLETREVEKALARLLRAEQARTKIPSRADADSFYSLGLIQDTQYLDIVSRNGYAPKWAQMYLTQAQAKRAQKKG